MKRYLKMTIPAVAALVALVAIAATNAPSTDTVLSLKRHVDAFEAGAIRQAARDQEIKIWLGEKRIRRDEGDVSTILRLDQNKMYLVFHPAKIYNAFDLPIDYKKLYPNNADEMVKRASEMMKLDLTVTPKEETRKIGEWQTKRYDLVMTNPLGMKVETTMWTSLDVGVDVSAMTKLLGAMASLQPGSLDWMKKMEEVKGFPVLQESTTIALGTPVKSTEQLVSVEKKEPPAGLYEPPAGYTMKPFDPMQSGVHK